MEDYDAMKHQRDDFFNQVLVAIKQAADNGNITALDNIASHCTFAAFQLSEIAKVAKKQKAKLLDVPVDDTEATK